MKKPSAVVVIALAGALGCKSKPAGKSTQPATSDGGPAVTTTDAGGATLDAASAAAAAPDAPARELVLGDDSLPAGQLAQIGGLKFAHAFELISQLVLTADGPISASSSYVRAWDRNGHLRWQSWTYGRVSRFAISPDGAHLAIVHSTPIGGRLTIVDRAGKPGPGSETERIETVAYSADGKRVVLAGPTVAIHDAASAERVATAKKLAIAAGFAGDGSVVFVAKDGIYGWTGASDAAPESLTAFPAPPTAAFVNADASTVWWSDGKAVTAFDVKTKAATPLAVTAPSAIVALTVSADGKALAASWKGGVRIFDLGATATQRWERTQKQGTAPAVGFGPDGKQIAVAEVDTVTLSDARTGGWSPAPAAPTFKGFTSSSFAVVAAADGTSQYDLSSGIKSPAVEDRPADAPAWVDSYHYDSKGTALGWASDATDACGTLKVWVSGHGESTLPKPGKCPADDLDTWEVGNSLVTDVSGRILQPEDRKVLFTLPASTRPLAILATSSDRAYAVAVYKPIADSTDESDAGTLIDVFQLADGALVKEYRLERGAGEGTDGIGAAAVLNDGTAYAGFKDGALFVIPRAADLPAPALTMDAAVTGMEVTPAGSTVAVTDADDRTIIFGTK